MFWGKLRTQPLRILESTATFDVQMYCSLTCHPPDYHLSKPLSCPSADLPRDGARYSLTASGLNGMFISAMKLDSWLSLANRLGEPALGRRTTVRS